MRFKQKHFFSYNPLKRSSKLTSNSDVFPLLQINIEPIGKVLLQCFNLGFSFIGMIGVKCYPLEIL